MRPDRQTEAHKTDALAELVCSNSFRGSALASAVGLLKEEMRALGSLVLEAADACAVCYGAEDSAMTAGLNNGILALLGVIAVVQGGFVALFVSIWKRARRLRRSRTALHLIQGGAG